MPDNSRAKGAQAERQARIFLENHGLETIECNYYCEYGEIDLIMKDPKNPDELVFVEVRSRKPVGYGSAIETITQSKINKIIKTAEHYLMTKNISHHTFCRFDVVGVDNIETKNMINWLPNAFEVGVTNYGA